MSDLHGLGDCGAAPAIVRAAPSDGRLHAPHRLDAGVIELKGVRLLWPSRRRLLLAMLWRAASPTQP
jgi:hypothetical protein